MVYFIEAVGSNRVKIGKTHYMRQTYTKLHRACPFPLSVLFILPGYTEEERAFHGRFSLLRRAGEWFEVADDLREFIFETKDAWDNWYVTRRCQKCGCFAGQHWHIETWPPDFLGSCDCGRCPGGEYEFNFDPALSEKYENDQDEWMSTPLEEETEE